VTNDKPYPGTQSVLRAVSLLKVFSDERLEWSLTELAQATQLNKTTTFRLLTALTSEGMVTQDPHTANYRLGPTIIRLGGCAMRSNDLRTVSRPELKALAATAGETASLEILTGDEVLILDEVIGEHVMSGGQEIGTRWPAYVTSTGKAILAHLPIDEIKAFLPAELRPLTPKTISSLDALCRDLALACERGYAVADEELEIGLIAVGTVIRDFNREVVGAISLSGPIHRLTPERIPEIGEMLKKAAGRISVQLGFPSVE